MQTWVRLLKAQVQISSYSKILLLFSFLRRLLFYFHCPQTSYLLKKQIKVYNSYIPTFRKIEIKLVMQQLLKLPHSPQNM